ncbi:hypothetical protein HRbin10_01525 [bacterium HR10]|nr:hypothetical protein HRbin10_01525 [bacterium HR10]
MAHFFADENVFMTTVRLLRDLGLNVQRAQELSLTGSDDLTIFRKAQELKAVLVTNDRPVSVRPPGPSRGGMG